MGREIEDCIAGWATRQHGVVTRSQLLEAGLSSTAITRRLGIGRLRALHRGVYLVGPVEPPLAREMAAVLVCGPGAVLSHVGAGRMWCLAATVRPQASARRFRSRPVSRSAGWRSGRVEESERHVMDGIDRTADESMMAMELDVTTDGPNRGRRPGVRVHRSHLAPDERAIRSGIPVTSIGRTLLDLAIVLGQRELESAVAQAEREELITRPELEALLGRHRGRIGTRAVRAVLTLDGGPALTRSRAESRFLELVRDAGLPVPETNVGIGPYEVDFLWRDAGLAIEVDGFRYHRSRPKFEGDRRRDAWLAARGISVIRISWRQIEEQPMSTAVQIGQVLVRRSPMSPPGGWPV